MFHCYVSLLECKLILPITVSTKKLVFSHARIGIQIMLPKISEPTYMCQGWSTPYLGLTHPTLNMNPRNPENGGISKNRGTPKLSILIIGFSIINHPFSGTPIFWKHPCFFLGWNNSHGPLLDKFINWYLPTLQKENSMGFSATGFSTQKFLHCRPFKGWENFFFHIRFSWEKVFLSQ